MQQAPDWWLASDGRWYPPQPAMSPPPPPPPAPPPPPPPPPSPFASAPTPWASEHYPLPQQAMARPATVPSTLSGWLQGLMWAAGGVAVITGVLAIVALNAFEDYRDAGIGTAVEQHAFDVWNDRNDTFAAMNAVLSMLWIGMFVVTIVWMNKAHKTTQRLWAGPRKWTSGWTVGGWFIPFANFVIPKRVLNEIERLAKAPRTGGVVGYGWQQESTSAVGWLWWIGLSLSIVFRTIGTSLLGDLTGPDDDITAGYTTQAIGSFLTVAAMPCGALYIRSLASRLSPRGIVQTP